MSVDLTDIFKCPQDTPHQMDVTDVKFPCTGFCYMIASEIPKLLMRFLSGYGYFDFIQEIIVKAGERKKNNNDIPYDGEYIDADTIKQDFPNIINKMNFMELDIVDTLTLENSTNELYMYFMELNIGNYMIITRSQETIMFVKIGTTDILVVDSHKTKHGILTIEDCVRYVTRNGDCKGIISIGYQYD